MSVILSALAPARFFYPVFVLGIALWLGARALLRRRAGREAWEAGVRTSERVLLTVEILGMVGLAILQIVLRNFFHTGLIWIEPMLRYLVLWIGFTAAVVATGHLRHIQINVIGRLLPPRGRLAVLRLTLAAAAVVCALLARAAWIYLGEEESFGASGLLGIPVWILTSVIFPAFALMAARFLARAATGGELLSSWVREEEADGS